MLRDDSYFEDVLDSARIAISYLADNDVELFRQNVQLQDACIRRLEIIGEAANRISEETRKRYSNLPWRKMIGMRNLMIHEYDDIDLEVVWTTIKDDLPSLVEDIAEILKP